MDSLNLKVCIILFTIISKYIDMGGELTKEEREAYNKLSNKIGH